MSHKIISGIYQIKNIINNRVYIGSSKYITERKQQHFKYLKEGSHVNKVLQMDFNKYGEDNFVFEVLEYVEPIKTLLIEREQHFLDNTFNKYNILVKAGDSTGYKQSVETREKISQTKISKGVWNKGISHSEQTKEKIGLANKGRTFNRESKNRKVINITTGEIFDKLKDAGEKYNIGYSNISDVCRGARLTAGGCKWGYL